MSTNRLSAVFSCIEKCESFADVGCDHGKLCKMVEQADLARRIYACDISEKCIEKAKILLSDCKRITFLVSDGLKSVPRVQTVAICGMGGRNVMEIISNADYKPRYILGAQKHVRELRLFLVQNGFKIEKDFVVEEAGKFYDVICAREGSMELTDVQASEGVFYTQRDETRKRRALLKLKKYSGFAPTAENLREKAYAEETLKWQSLPS